MHATYFIIVIVYVLAMLGIGYWCMRRTKSVGDFFLGGRKLGPWMSAFAFGTTYFSAVIFIGYAGKLGWGFGIHTMWIVVGNTLIGTVLSWAILAGRTRDMTVRLGALTMPEFLRTRFDSKAMQVISALVIFIFLLPYSASVYMGLGYLFQHVFNIQYESALIFLAVLTGFYLILGGYFAVAISDFLRGIIEFAGVLIMVILLANMHGGIIAVWQKLTEHRFIPALYPPHPLPGAHLPPQTPGPHFSGWIVLSALVLITSFGPWALPQMVQKFYSIRSKADVTRAMTIAGIFALFMSFGAYFCGAMTHLFYAKLPKAVIIAGKPNLDYLMPVFITDPKTHLPIALVLIILLMVFSASMSSLSSLVLVSSSAIAIDIYGAFVNRQAHQKQTMVLMRVLCAIFVLASLGIALKQFDVIVNLMVIAWSTIAGAFLAPFIYGLFWKRTTAIGAFAGMISGVATSIILFVLWGAPNIPVAGAIAMIVPMLVTPIVSLLTPPLPQSLIDAAFTDRPDTGADSSEVAA